MIIRESDLKPTNKDMQIKKELNLDENKISNTKYIKKVLKDLKTKSNFQTPFLRPFYSIRIESNCDRRTSRGPDGRRDYL